VGKKITTKTTPKKKGKKKKIESLVVCKYQAKQLD